MKNIIFIAPPAAGKGTCSDYLVANYGYEHLSTGDLLRSEIASGSEFGKEIDSIISKGNLVSDEVMIKLVQDKLSSIDASKPFILDGFPRTIIQAEKLDDMLISMGVTNMVAIYLNIDFDLALKRTLGRRSCPKCKRGYNVYFEEMMPINGELCDDCKVELSKRSDDNEESFKVRYDSYMKDANLIIEHYKKKHMLKTIVVGKLEDVLHDVVKEAEND